MTRLRLHPEVFDAAVAAGLFLRGPGLDATRRLLVDGVSAVKAAKDAGISHQAVYKTANKIKALAIERGICPQCGRLLAREHIDKGI